MTTVSGKDRSHESIINDTLARFLRERCSLSAVAETLHGGRRPDIIVRLPESPVIIETELEPALTGSIPACAGEPQTCPLCLPSSQVYPRVCGGTPLPPLPPYPALGLSPRVRGNRGQRHPAPPRYGSIPACAGEPVICVAGGFFLQVYPRVCGGTYIVPVGMSPWIGLSPRVRGNPYHPFSPVLAIRSIPACAGEPAQGGA